MERLRGREREGEREREILKAVFILNKSFLNANTNK